MLDLISFLRVCVIEDKSLGSDKKTMSAQLPQVVAEAIACLQQNLLVKQQVKAAKSYGSPFVSLFNTPEKNEVSQQTDQTQSDEHSPIPLTFSASSSSSSSSSPSSRSVESAQATPLKDDSPDPQEIKEKDKKNQPPSHTKDLYSQPLTDEDFENAGPLFIIVVHGLTFWFAYIPAQSVKRLLLRMKHYNNPLDFERELQSSCKCDVLVLHPKGLDFVDPGDRTIIFTTLDHMCALLRLRGESSKRRHSQAFQRQN